MEKVNDTWWWAEVDGVMGYVPTNHLSDVSPVEGEDRWQDNEYFSSYNTLVRTLALLSRSVCTATFNCSSKTGSTPMTQ